MKRVNIVVVVVLALANTSLVARPQTKDVTIRTNHTCYLAKRFSFGPFGMDSGRTTG